jgi:hypothetical protein
MPLFYLAIGAVVGGFIGFLTASLVYASKASALADQRKDDEHGEPEIARAARLSN